MMYPRKNLNRHVSWRRLFDVIKSPVQENTLPAVVSCPLCSGPRLTIFHDHVGTGQWHHCPDCASTGDMIQLASRFWKLSIQATIFKLHDVGFPIDADELTEDSITNYSTFRVAYREKMLNLWKNHKGNLLKHPKTINQLNKMHIRVDKFTAGNKQFHDLVGSADAREFEQQFIRVTRTEERQLRDVFKGGQWERVLVLPFYDKPGRVSGFYFIGRDGVLEQGDRFFRPTCNNYTNYMRTTYSDAGLYFHPSVTINRRAIIAINDPLQALRMNLKQINSGLPNLLNLVVWQHADSVVSRDAWEMFRGRKLVFWVQQPDYKFFAQVIRTGGYVSTYGPADRSEAGLRNFIRSYPPDEIITAVESKARPWSGYFDEVVATMDDNTLENLLLNLRLSDIDIVNAVHVCSQVTQARVKQLLSSDRGFKSAQWTQGLMVEERNDTWYALNPRKGTEYMLCNAVLQIDGVISSGDRMRYTGKIRHRGDVIPFVEDKKVLDRLGSAWLETKMIEHKLGVLRCDRSMRTQLVCVAKLLNEPKLYQGYSRVGWDSDTRTLVTPGYGIRFGGEVCDVSLFTNNSDTPAALPRPKTLLPIDVISLLSETPDYELMWAAWCGLVANILAPAFNRETMGLAVVGGKAAMAGKIAGLALGCVCVDAKKQPESYLAVEHTHGWPVSSSMDGDAIKNRLVRVIRDRETERNILLRVSPLTADVALLNGSWSSISALEVPELKIEMWEKLARIFPAYAKYLLTRKFTNFRQHAALVDDVASDVTYWLHSEYDIETSLLIKAVKKLQVPRPGKLGSVIYRLLAKLVEQKRLVVIKDGDWTRSPRMIRTDTHLLVSPEDVNRALISAHVPTLNKAAAIEHLRGVGTQEIEQDGLPLWNIPVAQWDVYSKPDSKLKIFKGA